MVIIPVLTSDNKSEKGQAIVADYHRINYGINIVSSGKLPEPGRLCLELKLHDFSIFSIPSSRPEWCGPADGSLQVL